MAFTQYEVVEVFKNSATINSASIGILRPDGSSFILSANRNIVAVLKFVNDENPEDIHVYFANGDDLSDKIIDNQARDIIASLNARDNAARAITRRQKAPDPIDQKLLDLTAAKTEFQKASQLAMVRFRDDPDELAKYQELLAAQAALDG